MLKNPWTAGDYVNALSVDLLRILWWSKTSDGEHGRNPPEPIPRPGDIARKATETEDLLAAAKAAGLIEVTA